METEAEFEIQNQNETIQEEQAQAVILSTSPSEHAFQATPSIQIKPAPIDPRLQLNDIYLAPEVRIPENIEVTKAKAYLKSTKLYGVLASRVSSLLAARTSGTTDTPTFASLEQYNIPSTLFFKDVVVSDTLELCKQVDVEGELPDLIALSKLWEWAGVSFGDSYVLFLALRQLLSDERLNSVRMWGKIYGTDKDYFIVEADTEPLTEETEVLESSEDNLEEDEESYAKPPKRITLTIPTEIGGINKYAYFVSSSINGPWIRLPNVLPAKLNIARNIRTYLSGQLDRQIKSFPPFNGNEAQYLRCQIARISSATVVCPANYYSIDEEDKSMKLNADYENAENESFLNPEQWVHHTPFILPQGRAEWVDTTVKKEDEEDVPEVEPETGPEFLRTVGSDEDYGKLPAWRTTLCSKFLTSKFSPVMIQSTRWPGARSIVYNNQFTNIYVGNGMKGLEEGKPFYPTLPDMMKEFTLEEGEFLVEGVDPTVEEEHVNEEELQEKVELAEDADE